MSALGFTIASILTFRRLRWLQNIAIFPEEHLQLLGALYGDLPWSRPQIDARGFATRWASPFLQQIFDDFDILALYNEAFSDSLGDSGIYVMFKDEFKYCEMDVVLCYYSAFQHVPAAEADNVQCNFVDPYGCVCQFVAKTKAGLVKHLEKHCVFVKTNSDI